MLTDVNQDSLVMHASLRMTSIPMFMRTLGYVTTHKMTSKLFWVERWHTLVKAVVYSFQESPSIFIRLVPSNPLVSSVILQEGQCTSLISVENSICFSNISTSTYSCRTKMLQFSKCKNYYHDNNGMCMYEVECLSFNDTEILLHSRLINFLSLSLLQDGVRQLVTKDLDTQHADFLQFYLRIGGLGKDSCNGAENRKESVLLQFSADGGITWTLLKELHHLEYQQPK